MSRSLHAALLITAVTLGCDSTPECYGISFVLDGVAHSPYYLNGVIGTSHLSMDSAEYDDTIFRELHLGIDGFAGRGTYQIAPAGSAATASLRLLTRQGIYDTRLFGGNGRIVVTEQTCHTWTCFDPEYSTRDTCAGCDVAGHFEITARNEAGESVSLTNGCFNSLMSRY